MPLRPPLSVAGDFEGVVAFFKDKGILPQTPANEVMTATRRLHRATYSLILWRFRLGRLPEHSRVFVEEIASDALQILPQALMGYSKTTKLLMRGVVENTLRHLYYSDHPVEFGRMNSDKKFFLNVRDLIEYLLVHPIFLETEPKFDAVNRVRALYSELSAGVHGSKVRDLEMRISLNKITFHPTAFKDQVAAAEKCTAASNFLLACFHRDRLRTLQQEDRQVILRTMSPVARRVWTELD